MDLGKPTFLDIEMSLMSRISYCGQSIVRSVRANEVTRMDAQEIEDGNLNELLTIWTKMNARAHLTKFIPAAIQTCSIWWPGKQVYVRVLKVKHEFEFSSNRIGRRESVSCACAGDSCVRSTLNCLQSSRSKRPRPIEELELDR